MTEAVRTLPIRLAPIPGEALDSWLEAFSCRLGAAWGDLTAAAGLSSQAGTAAFPPVTALTPAEAATLSRATGQDPARLHQMTLARYDGTGLRIMPGTCHVDASFPWARSRYSRFCPDCLRESDGRWQLFWRLGWAFACPRHGRLLADECPVCRQRHRGRPVPADMVPQPGRCAIQAENFSGRAPTRCGTDLATADTLVLPADHPALAAQHLVNAMIGSGTATWGIYQGRPVTCAEALADVRAVAGRVLAYATDEDLGKVLPPDLLAAYRTLKTRPGTARGSVSRPDIKPGLKAPAYAIVAAVGVTAALGILDTDGIESAGARMRWLITTARAKGRAVTATNIGWGRRITTELAAAQLAGLEPLLKPSDQLRYRLGTSKPTQPRHDASAVAAIAAKLPAALWPTWTVRLAPEGLEYRHLSTALSCAVLLVNTRLTLTQAAEAMGRDTGGHALSHILQRLEADSHWSTLRKAIIELADYVDAHQGPIDYRRRRSLDYRLLLPQDEWNRICRSVDIRASGSKKVSVVRCYLYAMISANSAQHAPWFRRTNDFVSSLANFPLQLTPRLADALACHAQSFLLQNQIDEPVTWCPPMDLIAGLDLPGADSHAIDTDQLHRLVQNSLTLTAIARYLGTSIEAVRQALLLNPIPERLRNPAPRPSPVINDLARALSASQLETLYHDENLTAKQIGILHGVSKQTVLRLARQYGITVRPPTRRRQYPPIDRAWIHNEYLANGRSLPDLAAEKGMSTANMTRWAKVHAVPLRARGAAHVRKAAIPTVLRPAAAHVNCGPQHLALFVAAATQGSYTVAARSGGYRREALVAAVECLEKLYGATLLNRARRGRSMTCTRLGAQIVEAYQGWSRGLSCPARSSTD